MFYRFLLTTLLLWPTKGLCSNNISESLHTLAMLGSQNLHEQLHSLILENLDTSDISSREHLNHLVQLIKIRFHFDTNVFSDKKKEQKLNIPFNLQISDIEQGLSGIYRIQRLDSFSKERKYFKSDLS